LRSLTFYDTLTDIGSGAFTGCSGLQFLKVYLKQGQKSCVKDILEVLWQRIDVEFIYADETLTRARLVFPQHYEEAVENTPARILYTQHHGSGNDYRQCFYNKEINYRKYDDSFVYAVARDKMSMITDMVFDRLLYPVELSEKHKMIYHNYIKENLKEIIKCLLKNDSIESIKYISTANLWDEENLKAAIGYCAGKDKELMSYLMNEKHKLAPAKKKKFEL